MPARKKAPKTDTGNLNEVTRLAIAIENVAGQMKVIQELLDDVYAELQWVVRSHNLQTPRHIVHVTSMPLDPTGAGFDKRVNARTAEEVAKKPGRRQNLFSDLADE